jgi:phytoene dehydrogenase-like protein
LSTAAPERCDAIVIGAGPAGLAAGIRLAQQGLSTVVLERHYLWGGLNSFYKKGGRRYDVGLHALTNHADPRARKLPLPRVLRQLRIPLEALQLGEQLGSRTVFPEASLRFSNDLDLLRSEVRAGFPAAADAFDALCDELAALPHAVEAGPASVRAHLLERLSDPLLVDLVLHPLLWYGSPTPSDVSWPLFVVLWKSIYEEGFARPRGGVRPVLELLNGRLREEGGELRLRTGVSEILHDGGRVRGVRTDGGAELEAQLVLSSAGWPETLRMLGPDFADRARSAPTGELTFVEACMHLDRPAPELGFRDTITFWNHADEALYRSTGSEPFDARSGVLCCPENYAGQEPETEGVVRTTILSSAAPWRDLEPEAYAATKAAAVDAAWEEVRRFAPDARPHAVALDAFTPRTITRFTGRLDGAVYGCPEKIAPDAAGLAGLGILGTDNGYLGIVGALVGGAQVATLSGASITPRALEPAPEA